MEVYRWINCDIDWAHITQPYNFVLRSEEDWLLSMVLNL